MQAQQKIEIVRNLKLCGLFSSVLPYTLQLRVFPRLPHLILSCCCCCCCCCCCPFCCPNKTNDMCLQTHKQTVNIVRCVLLGGLSLSLAIDRSIDLSISISRSRRLYCYERETFDGLGQTDGQTDDLLRLHGFTHKID